MKFPKPKPEKPAQGSAGGGSGTILDGLLRFTAVTSRSPAGSVVLGNGVPADYASLIGEYGGSTFGRGLYRIHTPESAVMAKSWILDYHLALHDTLHDVLPVGFDWLGREWVASGRELVGGQTTQMYLLDPSSAEVLDIPMGIGPLHREEFAEDGPDLLEAPWYESFRSDRGWVDDLGSTVVSDIASR